MFEEQEKARASKARNELWHEASSRPVIGTSWAPAWSWKFIAGVEGSRG